MRAAVRAAGIAHEEYFADHDPHADLSYCPHPERFKFVFVRHPFGVYGSYWRFKMVAGWDALNPFDSDCAAPSFEQFVRKVQVKYPGWCSRMFEAYVGTPDREIEFVGRFERLADDLVRALRMTGEVFNETIIRATPAVNVSTWPEEDTWWSRDLAREVAAAERDAFVRFGYMWRVWPTFTVSSSAGQYYGKLAI